MNTPCAIYYDSLENYIYIANNYGHTISRWTPGASNGTFIIGTPGKTGITSSTLNRPFAVTMDQYRNLYVTDYSNLRIMMYCSGTYNNPNTSGISILTTSYTPTSATFDSLMNMYVTDYWGKRVLKYTRL